MRALQVGIQNVLGIEYRELELGDVTEVLGDNGTGKTSTLDSIVSLLGGETKNLLRKGAEKGSVWMLLDDNTTIERTFDKGGTSISRRDAKGKEMGRAGEFVRQLTALSAIRPAQFLTCTDRERIDILLRATPINLAAGFRSYCASELGITEAVLRKHGVIAIDEILESAENQRLRAGQEKRAKDAACNEMADTLKGANPEQDAAFWEQRIRELTVEHDKTTAVRNKSWFAIDAVVAEGKQQLREEFNAEEAAIMAEARLKIEAARARMNESLAATMDEAAQTREAASARYQEAMDKIAPELAEAREKAITAQRITSQFSLLKRYGAEAANAEAEWRRLNEAVDKVREEKAKLLSRLPIKGLEIAQGRLMRHGVLFDSLNTAQQIEIVLEVAELVSGKLPLIVADGMERLTPANRKALIEAAASKGLQFIFATAIEGMPLTVRQYNAADGPYTPPEPQLQLVGGAR